MENSNNISRQPMDDEIDLLELFNKYIKPYWKTYLKSAFLFAFLFTAMSYKVTPKYEATVKLQVNSGEGSSASGRLGGLASLAGISMGASGGSDVLFNINYLQSREVAEAFIKKEGLREKLFYKSLNEDGQFVKGFSLRKALFGWMSSNPLESIQDEDIYNTPGPSTERTYKAFSQVFLVDVNQKDMTAQVSVRWSDPLQAKLWANAYVGFINDILRRKAIHESNLKIEYLESQIDQNRSVEVQQSIYSLVENELKKIAVAESSDQYAFKVVQRAFLPEQKASPKRKMYLVLGGFSGLFIVFARIFYREFLAKLNESQA